MGQEAFHLRHRGRRPVGRSSEATTGLQRYRARSSTAAQSTPISSSAPLHFLAWCLVMIGTLKKNHSICSPRRSVAAEGARRNGSRGQRGSADRSPGRLGPAQPDLVDEDSRVAAQLRVGDRLPVDVDEEVQRIPGVDRLEVAASLGSIVPILLSLG